LSGQKLEEMMIEIAWNEKSAKRTKEHARNQRNMWNIKYTNIRTELALGICG
jgi:hypothetical protein